MSESTLDLQLLPELEPAVDGAHMAVSCNVTCPWDTSDSIPSMCCAD
ncbi:hypothetical protein [Streptomyces sp. B6B3]